MNPTEKQVKKLLFKSSQKRLFLSLFFLALVLLASTLIRLYAIEPVVIKDRSISPYVKRGARVWVCKLPWCVNKIKSEDIVLAEKRVDELLLRRVIGVPGSFLKVSSEGHVTSEFINFVWQNETAFIDTRSFYIPKKGDTLFFNRLNDIETDFAISILKEQKESFYVKPSLYQGEKELPIDLVGSARIASRPVSVREIPGLPWQELFLIELQVQRGQPGVGKIKIQRDLYRTSDSTKIESLVALDDYFYLACSMGNRCIDSRELGLFSRSMIIAKKH